MDIEYLLFLQNIREGFFGGALNDFAAFLSDFVVNPWMLMFFAIVYWESSKKDGFYFFLTYAFAELVNAIIKLTACVYRPWIKDPRVLPAGDAITHATGYSFPSGHSITAVTSYGSVAVWQWKKRKWIGIICIVLILLTMFSRNFLGVHFPQDVLIGCLHSSIILILCIPFSKWLEKCNSKQEIIVFLVGLALALVAAIYVNCKPYPMDYVDGKLLVDPAKMMVDGNAAIGMYTGLVIGWFVERRYIKFEVFKNKRIGLVIAIIAVIPIYFWRTYSGLFLTPIFDASLAKAIIRFMEYIWVLILIPLVINAVNKRTQECALFNKKKTS